MAKLPAKMGEPIQVTAELSLLYSVCKLLASSIGLSQKKGSKAVTDDWKCANICRPFLAYFWFQKIWKLYVRSWLGVSERASDL